MNNNLIEQIVYLDYTSTSKEDVVGVGSARPDSLANIMKNNIVIIQEENSQL